MASITETVKYDYIADTTGFTKNVDAANKSNANLDTTTKKTNKSTSKMAQIGTTMSQNWGPIVGTIGAVTAAVGLLGTSTTELVGKQNMVTAAYGENTDAAMLFFDNIGGQLAVPSQELALYGAAMSITAQNYGFAAEQSVIYGAAVTNLSAIIASYLGLPVADVAERISAAMRGEAESAEALGLSLNETAVSSYALANGATKAWTEMSTMEQFSWRLFTAISQVATMMGIEVGQINSVETATAALNLMTEEAGNQTTKWQELIALLKEELVEFLNRITPVIEAIAAFIIVVIEAKNRVMEIITAFIEWIGSCEGVQTAVQGVKDIAQSLHDLLSPMIQRVQQAVDKFIAWWSESENLQAILQQIKDVIDNIMDAVNRALSFIDDIIERFTAWMEESILLQAVLDAIALAVGKISLAVETLIGWINAAIQAFQDFRAQDFGSDLVNLGSGATDSASVDVTRSINHSINGAVSGLGLSRGVQSVASNIQNQTENVFNITTNQVMSYREAYRNAQLVQARGTL